MSGRECPRDSVRPGGEEECLDGHDAPDPGDAAAKPQEARSGRLPPDATLEQIIEWAGKQDWGKPGPRGGRLGRGSRKLIRE